MVSLEKYSVFPVFFIVCLISQKDFKIFFLTTSFQHLIMMGLGVVFWVFALPGIHWVFLVLCVYHCDSLCKKLPQIGWVKTRKFYFLIVLEVGSPNSRSQEGPTPSKGSRGESYLASFSFQCLQAFPGLWLRISFSDSSLHGTSPFVDLPKDISLDTGPTWIVQANLLLRS